MSRPHVASSCKSLAEAQKWRRELVNEVTNKIGQIQNAQLGEARIRELNDEINKLTRTRHYWDIRVRELGGPDHSRAQRTAESIEGKELPGESKGGGSYKYYGAAQQLPGIREIFEEHQRNVDLSHMKRKRTWAEVYKNITPEYYGFGEEDDARLLALEKAQERELQQQAIREHKERVAEKEVTMSNEAKALSRKVREMEDAEDDDITGHDLDVRDSLVAKGAEVTSYVSVPSEEEIALLVVEEKKKRMLAAFL